MFLNIEPSVPSTYVCEVNKSLPNTYDIINGEKIVLEVATNSEQPLTHKWFKNGVAVEETSADKRVKSSFKNGVYSLVIEKANPEVDNGAYTFAVKDVNTNKIISTNSQVFIKGNSRRRKILLFSILIWFCLR